MVWVFGFLLINCKSYNYHPSRKMSLEGKVSWEFLKEVSNTLDSYRVRALIDAKEDILNAGIYSEEDYNDILFTMFDEELLKYELFEYLKSNARGNLQTLRQFARDKNLDFRKAYDLFILLYNEKVLKVEELFDEIPSEEEGKPPKKIFKDLKIETFSGDITKIKSIYEPVEVIFEQEICSGCGLCAGICPVNCITIENGFGKVDTDTCIRCGLCYYVCPRSYLPIKSIHMHQGDVQEIKNMGKVGPFLKAFSARTKIPEIREICQDGGISSTCLYYLFDKNIIDRALGAKMSEDPWRPEPYLMKTKEDVLLTSGTKYVNNPNLSLLNDAELRDKNLAVVGVPCQMQALLKSKIYDINLPSLKNILYRIGIFCMESFPYNEGFLKICEKLNVNVLDVKKTDINKGKFFVYTKSGEELTIAIKDISNLAREDCEVCYDLTSESADISVGSIGAPSGWNFVLIRTPKGEELYNALIENDLIESKHAEEVKPGLPLLNRIAGIKKNKCMKHVNSKKEKNEKYPFY